MSLFASVLAPPLRVTVDLVVTFCAGPALATGAELPTAAVMVTVDALLFTDPSFTVNAATYVPSMSATNLGFTAVASERAAVLPFGVFANVQV